MGSGILGPHLPFPWPTVLWLAGAAASLFSSGAAFGYLRGRRQGQAVAPLLLRRRLLEEGRCPVCGSRGPHQASGK